MKKNTFISLMQRIAVVCITNILITCISFADETAFSNILENSVNKDRVSTSTERLAPPFGANLFSGSFSAQQTSGLDANYIISSGDSISLHIWGAIQADETTTVDSQGNIFIPEVGAVKVQGSRASELPSLVKRKLKSVYRDGVDVYVNLITATPINVFVTGYVERPGQYSGMQADSILSFLHKSGGILETEGSYRNIRIIRNERPIATVDLYAFLRWGKIPRINFKSGDTILVGQQNAIINVSGDVRGEYRFELSNKSSTGRDLISITRPMPSVTNVAITGTRSRIPWSAYINLSKFSKTTIRDGDSVRFTTDATSNIVNISIEGSHLGNSYYAAKKGTRLKELLDYVAVSPDDADIQNIYIKRKSVALKQKNNLNETIDRLEQSLLATPAKSSSEISIRQQESTLLSKFIDNARKVEPDGRIVISEKGNIANIRLEDDDIIVIPAISDLITVSGEVNTSQTLVYSVNASAFDYIERSGGFTKKADKLKLIIRKPNGKIISESYTQLEPGDEILVYPKIDTKSLQFTKDLVSIIFQIAAASKAVGIF